MIRFQHGAKFQAYQHKVEALEVAILILSVSLSTHDSSANIDELNMIAQYLLQALLHVNGLAMDDVEEFQGVSSSFV